MVDEENYITLMVEVPDEKRMTSLGLISRIMEFHVPNDMKSEIIVYFIMGKNLYGFRIDLPSGYDTAQGFKILWCEPEIVVGQIIEMFTKSNRQARHKMCIGPLSEEELQ